jgi:hypothetical protein
VCHEHSPRMFLLYLSAHFNPIKRNLLILFASQNFGDITTEAAREYGDKSFTAM